MRSAVPHLPVRRASTVEDRVGVAYCPIHDTRLVVNLLNIKDVVQGPSVRVVVYG